MRTRFVRGSLALGFGLALALAPMTYAMERAFGFSRILSSGDPAPSATITVRDAGTANLSTIFSDNSSTPKGNPFTADSNGYWFYYAANGRFDITFSGGGIPTPYTLSDFLLVDSQSIGSIGGVAGPAITLAVGTAGPDFAIVGNDPTDTITYNLPSASGAARGLVTTGAQTIAGAKTFTTPIAAGSGGTGFDGSAAANGKVPIGNGSGFSLANITGTANQVVVTNGAGTIALSGPQNLGPASNPTFAILTLTDNLLFPNRAGTPGPLIVDVTGAAALLELADGEIVIGRSGLAPSVGTIGSGPGIGVANGAGSITIQNTAQMNGSSFNLFPAQTFAVSTTGSDFSIGSTGGVHTFSLPDAGTAARGLVTPTGQTFGGTKSFINGIVTGNVLSAPVTSGTNQAAVPFTLTAQGGTGTGTNGQASIYTSATIASGSTPQPSYQTETWGSTNTFTASDDTTETTLYGHNGGQWIRGSKTELVTTNGSPVDTSANLLPQDAIIEAVTTSVTQTVSGGGVTAFSVGDPTTAARFSASAGGLTAGSTRVGLAHMSGAVTTLAAGPTQAAAAKVRITFDAAPAAGTIRVVVFYMRFIP